MSMYHFAFGIKPLIIQVYFYNLSIAVMFGNYALIRGLWLGVIWWFKTLVPVYDRENQKYKTLIKLEWGLAPCSSFCCSTSDRNAEGCGSATPVPVSASYPMTSYVRYMYVYRAEVCCNTCPSYRHVRYILISLPQLSDNLLGERFIAHVTMKAWHNYFLLLHTYTTCCSVTIMFMYITV